MSRPSFQPARVEITDLRKEFGAKVALNGVSLVVEPGTFTVLLGPSGSGKTTLLRCLAGIEQPTSGVITIGAETVFGPGRFVSPDKRELSMVFQDYALWPHMTVRKNIAFPLVSSSLSKSERAQRVDNLLERVGISALADRYPNELSGGEQQRVALARALSARVGLVLFDEPLSNLDADRRDQLRIEIATLTRDAGVTAVYITHDQSEAFALADRVGVLRQGELVQYSRPEKIYRHPKNAFVARFTGVAGEFPVTDVREISEKRVTVQLPFAPHMSIEATKSENSPYDKDPHLFVRAAGVTLHPVTSRDGAPGIIRDVAYNGRGYEHVVEVGEKETLTKVYSPDRFNRGDCVKVQLDPVSCFVMNAQEEV
ncbi:MAG: ABC transporter ATP-binding protein [Acidobacteria bacterium]|nr:ABC transporter ATP-binding protein [Acidobacteriota bacterium]